MAATVTASNHASSSGAATTVTVSAVVATGDRLLILAIAAGTLTLSSVVRGSQSATRRGGIQFPGYRVEAWAIDNPTVGTADVVVTSPSSVKLGAGVFAIAGAAALIGAGYTISFNTAFAPDTFAYGAGNTPYPPALGIAMMVSDVNGVTIAKNNAADTALFTDTGIGTTDLHLAAVSGTSTGPGNIFAAGWSPSWTLGSADDWATVTVTIASGSGPTIIPPQIVMGRSTFASDTGTSYNSFPRAGGNFGAFQRETPVLAAGTLSNLMVRVRTAPGGAATRTFTLQKNAADTLLTVTISAAGTVATDTTNVATIVSGDTLTLKHIPSGTPAAADAIEWSCDFTPTTAGQCIYGGYSNGVFDTISTPCFNALFAPTCVYTWNTSLLNRPDIISVPGTLDEWGVHTGGSFTSGVVYEFYLYKNGVKQDGTGGTVDSLITLTGTGSAPLIATKVVNLVLAVQDQLYVQCEQTAGTLVGFSAGPVLFCRFTADTPGTFNIFERQEIVTGSGYAAVVGASHDSGGFGDPTESLVKMRIGPSGLNIDGITVRLTTAPTGVNTISYKVRKNEADASVAAATITGSALVGSGAGTPASYAVGDFIDVGLSTTGSPATGIFSFSLAGRIGTSAPNAYQVTQLGALIGYDEDAEDDDPPTVTACTGGGTVASGTNPAAGTSLATATIPLASVVITPISGPVLRYAGVGIPHGVMREARAESLGKVKRQLCDADHGYEASVVTSVLIDHDGALREAGPTLKGAQVDYFIDDLETLKAAGTQRRQFRGILDEWEAKSDRMFEITSVDILTARLTSIDADDLQTPVVLIDGNISDQNPLDRMLDKPCPEPYGAISDEADANPEGVWEAKHLGFLTLTGDEDLGNVALFMGSIGPVKNNQAVFGADVLSGDPPTLRIKLGASAFGDWRTDPDAYLLVPGKTGWIESFNYLVRGGKRYNLLLGRDGHPAVMQAVEGRIPFALNFCAREATGDATGTLIDSGPHAIAHWLNASVLQVVGDANWPAQASFGDYSILDTATFAAVHTITNALSYKFAGVVGWDFEQRSWRDNLAEMCRSVGAEFYSNRHGQGCLSKLDVSATGSGATAFTTKQILEGSMSVDQKLDAVENTVRYVYKRAYKGALADLTPVEGSRLYRDPYDGQWGSGLQTDSDSTSITALGGDPKGVRRSRVQEYYFVRETATADALAAERLALRAPAAGRAEVSFSTLLKYSTDVELGDIVTLEHWDCPWTGSRRCRVLAKETDLDEMEERLTVQDVDDLLA